MTSDWSGTLSCHLSVKGILYTLNTYPQLSSISFLRPAFFEIQGYGKSDSRCTEGSQNDFKHLTVESMIYSLVPYPREFDQVRSVTSHLWDTRLSKIGNVPTVNQSATDLRLILTLNIQNTYTPGPSLHPLWCKVVNPAFFEIHCCGNALNHLRVRKFLFFSIKSKKCVGVWSKFHPVGSEIIVTRTRDG